MLVARRVHEVLHDGSEERLERVPGGFRLGDVDEDGRGLDVGEQLLAAAEAEGVGALRQVDLSGQEAFDGRFLDGDEVVLVGHLQIQAVQLRVVRLEEEKERMIEMVEQFTAERAMEKAALESERDRWRLKSEQFTADFASEKAQLTAGFASEKLELEAQMNTWVVKCEQYTANEFASNTDMQDMAEATKEMKEKLQIAENSRGEAYGKLIDSNFQLSNEKATLTKELVAALDQVARLQEQVPRSGSGAEGANGWILDGK